MLSHKKKNASIIIQQRNSGQYNNEAINFKIKLRTSLVAQWLRFRLPMQGKRVLALVREDPTCHGATKPKPVRHNY